MEFVNEARPCRPCSGLVAEQRKAESREGAGVRDQVHVEKRKAMRVLCCQAGAQQCCAPGEAGCFRILEVFFGSSKWTDEAGASGPPESREWTGNRMFLTQDVRGARG
jgi:hypothetical protein